MNIVHVLARPTDARVLCGEKRDAKGGPRVWAPFAMTHQRNYGMVLCAECKLVAVANAISLDTETPADVQSENETVDAS